MSVWIILKVVGVQRMSRRRCAIGIAGDMGRVHDRFMMMLVPKGIWSRHCQFFASTALPEPK